MPYELRIQVYDDLEVLITYNGNKTIVRGPLLTCNRFPEEMEAEMSRLGLLRLAHAVEGCDVKAEFHASSSALGQVEGWTSSK
jgi:hypothetical protein